LERFAQKGGVKSLLLILTSTVDIDAQRFSALALANVSSAGELTSIAYSLKKKEP
jgi:hypothetical protein